MNPKSIYTITSSRGFPAHHSVGAIIERKGKYLMIERANEPFGLAGVAGHIDEGEEKDPGRALIREIEEEVGLPASSFFSILPVPSIYGVEVLWNHCRSAGSHTWWLYHAVVAKSSEPKFDAIETKGGGWYSPAELAKSNLEPIWREWYERLGIIPRKPRVTVCGSMAFAQEMFQAASLLNARGWLAIAPSLKAKDTDGKDCSFTDVIRERGVENIPADDPVWVAKRNAILEHFRWLDWCDIALIWNEEKRGIPGYIGTNTMMEIGWALGHAKRVVTLHPLNPVSAGHEEAKACVSDCLNGVVDHMVAFWPRP